MKMYFKKSFILSLCLVFGLCLCTSKSNASDQLLIPFYDQPRGNLIIIEEDGEVTGLYPDLFRAILDKAGIKYKFYKLSQHRKNIEFQEGRAVLDCCKNPNWVRKPKEVAIQLFSEPFYQSNDVFIFPKGKSFPVESIESLSNKKVATVRGFGYLGEEWFGERYDLTNETQLIRFVANGRADVGIVNDVITLTSEYKKQIELGPIHDKASLHIRVHRKRVDLLAPINEAIKSLKKDGTFDLLESKYSSAY